MTLDSTTFMNWYYNEASADERALWDKVAAMMYDYFEDMLFRRDTITEPFVKVQTVAVKGDIYSDEYLDGEWEDEVLSLPDTLEYFSAEYVRVNIANLSQAKGMFHIRSEDGIPEIVIGKNYLDDDTVIAHELIHLHESILEEYLPYARDIVFWALYQDLKSKIGNLDDVISRHLPLLNIRDINWEGGKHDLLFFVKSLDLDLRLGKELGTVFGYGQNRMV